MAARYAAMELESNAGDSVASTPRSEHHQNLADDGVSMQQLPRVRFMCSFGGKILPRPHDNQLRYVGGDTRIVALNRHASFSSLLVKLSKIAGTASVVVKYQLPNEDLDSLITVTTDEDVENMMDEYDRVVAQSHKAAARLRLFLFPTDADSRASTINSILDGSAKREHWFFDALNGGSGRGLERGRSEASSIVSEVPDYLFGLENADEPPLLRESRMMKNKHLFHENASNSDPGSPAPAVSSPFCSTSSALATPNVTVMPDLPPVKTKPDQPIPAAEPKATSIETAAPHQQSGYPGSPYWHYTVPGPQVQPMPIYYVPGVGPVQAAGGSHPPAHPIPQRGQYVQPYQVIPGQVPVGLPQQVSSIGQVYGGMRPVMGLDSHEINPAVLYGARNGGTVPAYSSAGGEEMEGKVGRVPHPG
ncbi:PREDICTED: uncharacterized protein LOC109170482 [Ipomoea nil]|uniref:uncharacterized protein LOC109170482 n=1 Tax=Ipomoea nil TaxID=35883 RepID=UPI000901268F|nr:PREDICTED: uncharacterized protein LOC109170482 [Ipomoea nil]